MKDWIRISSHLVDCRDGKKENGGVSVIDWVDLADWDLLQIWVWMRCGWFVAWFGVHFERYGGMIICCCFHDSDWISIISDADRHYFRVRTAITLSRMPLNELWGGWEGVLWVVCGTKRSHVPLGDQLKKRWRAPMSICERGMKWVLPLIVTLLSFLRNAIGRFTVVSLGMSKPHSMIEECYFQEWSDRDQRMWN